MSPQNWLLINTISFLCHIFVNTPLKARKTATFVLVKKTIAILLAILILSVSMKDLAIYAAFKANQEYLAENVCLNRFTPEDLCYASCVLTATIQDRQENQNLPSVLLDNYQLILCPIELKQTLRKVNPIRHLQLPTSETSWTSTAFLDDIFHPPEC